MSTRPVNGSCETVGLVPVFCERHSCNLFLGVGCSKGVHPPQLVSLSALSILWSLIWFPSERSWDFSGEGWRLKLGCWENLSFSLWVCVCARARGFTWVVSVRLKPAKISSLMKQKFEAFEGSPDNSSHCFSASRFVLCKTLSWIFSHHPFCFQHTFYIIAAQRHSSNKPLHGLITNSWTHACYR